LDDGTVGGIVFTYDDDTPKISATVQAGEVDHNSLQNYDANRHIDHTAVTLTAGTGLTGGGDISANRTFAVDGVLEDLDTLGACAADSEFLVGTGAGALAWESGATVRTSLGLGTGDSPQFTAIELGHASDTTIARSGAGTVTIEGVEIMMVGGAPTAHLHDGDTLQNDGINSDAGGGFSFTTAALVTFNNSILLDTGADITVSGHILFNTDNSYIGFTDGSLTFNDTNHTILVAGTFLLPDSGYIGCASDTTALQILPAGDVVLTDSLYTNKGLYILERDATVGAAATWGHIWVKNDAPNTLWFTDDEGNDIQLGTGIAAHAMLDGSVHTDSVADDVSRGSIIYGNATPKWDELVKGAADTFLGSDGTDISYRTAAQVMASLSGEAGAAFSINSQSITDVGSIVVNDDGTIGVTDGTPGITFDDTDGQVEISGDLVSPGGNIHAGVDGTTRGFFRAYGPAGSDYGGSFISYVSAGEDDTIDSYMFTAYQDDCHVCYAQGVGAIITVVGPTCNVHLSTNLVLPDAGTIGSESDADIMTLAADGTCTFSVFPVTPSAEPDADYEVANKKYVDDHGGGGTDVKVAIDAVATAGYLGAANNDGVLQCADPLIWNDNGDFVQLTLSYGSTLAKTGSALGCDVGITDDKILQVDDADAADDDYAKFTANGIEGRSYSEVLGDLSGQADAAFDLNGQDLTNGGVIFLTEQAAAEADVEAKGQIWVKTATPNELWFQDDAGTDHQLGVGGYTTMFKAWRTSGQTISKSTWEKVELNTEVYDVDGDFDASTNYRFVAPADGYYNFIACMGIYNMGDGVRVIVRLYKNGIGGTVLGASELIYGDGTGSSLTTFLAADAYLETDDYVELWVTHDDSSDRNTSTYGSCVMSGHRIG